MQTKSSFWGGCHESRPNMSDLTPVHAAGHVPLRVPLDTFYSSLLSSNASRNVSLTDDAEPKVTMFSFYPDVP